MIFHWAWGFRGSADSKVKRAVDLWQVVSANPLVCLREVNAGGVLEVPESLGKNPPDGNLKHCQSG